MHCSHVKKHLLLYLDDDLPATQREEIQSHLAECSNCSQELNQLQNIWCNAACHERIEPSSWLWTRISAQLMEAEPSMRLLAEIRSWLTVHAVPLVATALIAIGIMIGVYLGAAPQTNASQKSLTAAQASARAEFIKTSHLDAFDDLPPSSVGGAFLALESNQP